MGPLAQDKSDIYKDSMRILVLCCLYFLTGKIGLSLSIAHANVTLIWPPSGFALAFMLLYGYRMWIGVALGAFLVNLTTDISLLAVFGIAIGNSMMAITATYLLRQNDFHPDFSRLQDVSALMFLGAFCAAMVSASVGTTSLLLSGAVNSALFSAVLLDWWLGDAMGVMIIAPFLLLVLNRPAGGWPDLFNDFLKSLQGGLLALLIGALIFGGFLDINGLLSVSLLAPLAIIIWCAYRFGPLGVSIAIICFSGVALIGTSFGRGPFFEQDMHFSFILFFAYIMVHALIGLLIATALIDRKKQQMIIDGLKDHLDHLSHSVPDLMIILDDMERCMQIYCVPALDVSKIKNKPLSDILDPDQNKPAYRALQYAKSSGTVQIVETTLCLEGVDETFQLRISPIKEDSGQMRTALLFRK